MIRARGPQALGKGSRFQVLGARLKHVADTANRMGRFVEERIIDFRAKPAYGGLNHAGVGIEIDATDHRCDLCPRQHVTDVADQQHEQCELLRRQIDTLAAANGSVFDRVDFKISCPEQLGLGSAVVARCGGVPCDRSDHEQAQPPCIEALLNFK